MGKEFIDLFEFQSLLKEGVEGLFPSRLWLRAEVSSVKARPGGHCYLELSQSGASGLLAKANAIIWSSRYRMIAPYFRSVTGSDISVGMVLLLEVQVSYTQLYGFSLIINDVDPEYSLGVKELQRQQTLKRLEDEGLMELQRELGLPPLPYDLAVISAADAAGYRDFIRHLDENEYGFRVNTVLYPALMQGADAPVSIISAMDEILASGVEYDAVLIVRGGGARLDLACYDDYELAAAVARCPLPVLTAIGHDQDFHVCDAVAHAYVRTPTALADLILGMYEDEDGLLSSFMSRIKLAFNGRMSSMESAVAVLESRIMSSDPSALLRRGYTLATDAGGVVLKSASGCAEGDRVSVLFADGRLECRIEKVLSSENMS